MIADFLSEIWSPLGVSILLGLGIYGILIYQALNGDFPHDDDKG